MTTRWFRSGCHEPIRLTMFTCSPVSGCWAENGCSRTVAPCFLEVGGDHLPLLGVGLRAGDPGPISQIFSR